MISRLKENNVAVVTGGANGIGRSAVDAFLARGLHVVAIDRDEQALGDLKAAGILTDEEFDAKKKELLSKL